MPIENLQPLLAVYSAVSALESFETIALTQSPRNQDNGPPHQTYSAGLCTPGVCTPLLHEYICLCTLDLCTHSARRTVALKAHSIGIESDFEAPLKMALKEPPTPHTLLLLLHWQAACMQRM